LLIAFSMKIYSFIQGGLERKPRGGKHARWRIILDLDEKQEVSFKWCMGGAINNKAEALALYQGLIILDSRKIRNLIVIGDSK
jgi:ribonuclease HI